MNVQAPNPFVVFWSLGYRALVPIVPPGAAISPKSALAKRPGSIGKAVGIQRRDGSWSGMDWIRYAATEADLRDWCAMGAGVGLKTGSGVIALDIDTLERLFGDIVQALAVQMLGPAPVRWGRAPKRLMLYRAPPETPYMRVIFDDGLPAKVGKEPRVELLTDQRQCVVHGIHPDTGQPYRWDGLCPLEELTVVTAEQVRSFFARLAAELPAARVAVDEAATDRQHVNQEALRGRSDLVVEAVRRLPNRVDLFPTYDDYIRVGAAIKGALPDDPGLAEECFVEWAARFEGDDDFDPARAAADLRRVKPPYGLGASWLYDQAERHGGAPSFVAETWFDAGAAPAATAEGSGLLFGISPSPRSGTESQSAPIAWIDPTTWEGRPVVQREWEVDNLIPRREVTLLYGDGGIGKTLAAHQYATCAAAGVPWFGQNTRKARVMCFFCEDDADELHRRQVDINRSLGIGFGDLADLRVVSRKHQDNFLMTWSRHGGEPRLSEVWRQLLADAQRFCADVIILDTIADIFGGSEIDRVQVNYFVKTCLGGLAQGIGGSVMALGHPSQSGKTEGTSGSTAWNNAARSRLFLRYPKGVDRGDIRELEAMKLNYGPRGSLLKLRWKRGAFEVLGARMPAGATLSVDVPKIEDTAEAAVAAGIMASPDERMSLARNSKYYAATVLRQRHPDLLETLTHNEVQAAIERLRQRGQLQETMIGREENSRPVKGLRVLETLKGELDGARSSIFA